MLVRVVIVGLYYSWGTITMAGRVFAIPVLLLLAVSAAAQDKLTNKDVEQFEPNPAIVLKPSQPTTERALPPEPVRTEKRLDVPKRSDNTLTNSDVEAREIRTIPVLKSVRPTRRSTPSSGPPPARADSYRNSRDYSGAEVEALRDVMSRSSESREPDAQSAEDRLDRMLGSIPRATDDFDPRRHSDTVSFRGDFSIHSSSLDPGQYALVFAADSVSALRLGAYPAKMTIMRSGRAAGSELSSTVRLSGGVFNFAMTRSGSVSFRFDLPKEASDIEGYIAYSIVPMNSQMRLKLQD